MTECFLNNTRSCSKEITALTGHYLLVHLRTDLLPKDLQGPVTGVTYTMGNWKHSETALPSFVSFLSNIRLTVQVASEKKRNSKNLEKSQCWTLGKKYLYASSKKVLRKWEGRAGILQLGQDPHLYHIPHPWGHTTCPKGDSKHRQCFLLLMTKPSQSSHPVPE